MAYGLWRVMAFVFMAYGGESKIGEKAIIRIIRRKTARLVFLSKNPAKCGLFWRFFRKFSCFRTVSKKKRPFSNNSSKNGNRIKTETYLNTHFVNSDRSLLCYIFDKTFAKTYVCGPEGSFRANLEKRLCLWLNVYFSGFSWFLWLMAKYGLRQASKSRFATLVEM